MGKQLGGRRILMLLLAAMLVTAMLAACSGGNNSGQGGKSGNEAGSNGTGAGSGQGNGGSGNGNGSGGGSSDGNGSGAGSDGEEPKKPVKINFWHIYSDGPEKELYEQLIAEFQQQYDYITVEQLGTSFWDYWTKLSTSIAGGSAPDLALNDTSTAISRAQNGVIVNLTPFIERDQFNVDDYFPVLIDRVKYEGDLYALPNDTDVRLLFYDKAAFREVGLDPEKPPTNWEELESYADQLTKWNDKKLLDRVGFSPTMGNIQFWTLAWANGGDFWDDDLKPTYNRAENVQTLEWMANIQAKYGTKALSAFNVQSGALSYSPFIAGRVAMIVDVNNLYGEIKRHKPDLDFGVAPIPYPVQQASWSAGFDLEIIDNKDPDKAAAAWELMKFLTSKETQIKIHKVVGSLVSNMHAAKDPEFISDPIWQMIVDQMDHSRFIEYVEASPSWHSGIQPIVDSVLNGSTTAQKALDDAQKAIENELKNYEAMH